MIVRNVVNHLSGDAASYTRRTNSNSSTLSPPGFVSSSATHHNRVQIKLLIKRDIPPFYESFVTAWLFNIPLKGLWWWYLTTGLTSAVDIVRHLKFNKTQLLKNWVRFRLSVEAATWDPYVSGPQNGLTSVYLQSLLCGEIA